MEAELRKEYAASKKNFYYDTIARRFRFDREYIERYKTRVIGSFRYLWRQRLGVVLTIPVIWSVLIPAFMLDIFVTMYQAICFPVYKIPKVRRKDYIVIDRYHLFYLNRIERINCLYCEYFNGLMGYVREVAGRTEQYWCPIKHADKLPDTHSRYDHFFDYGDADSYQKELKQVRKDFEDIKEHE